MATGDTRTYPNTLGLSTIEHLDEVLAKASELGEIGDILCSQVAIREVNEITHIPLPRT